MANLIFICPSGESYWSRVALLTGVGTTLLEGDIRRLVPGKAHIPEFKHEFDILHGTTPTILLFLTMPSGL